jgi:phosphocarrier protein HPr
MSDACADLEIINELGLHARAAAKVVRTAGAYESHVTLEKDGRTADAKSIMGVLLLCGERGSTVRVRATGVDAEVVVNAIRELFASRFGEDR